MHFVEPIQEVLKLLLKLKLPLWLKREYNPIVSHECILIRGCFSRLDNGPLRSLQRSAGRRVDSSLRPRAAFCTCFLLRNPLFVDVSHSRLFILASTTTILVSLVFLYCTSTSRIFMIPASYLSSFFAGSTTPPLLTLNHAGGCMKLLLEYERFG